MSKLSILVIDDASDQLAILELYINSIKALAVQFFKADSVDSGIKIIQENPIDLIISDLQMPEKTGKDLLLWARKNNPNIQVVIMTAGNNIADAVELMKLGAYDYLLKPIKADVIEELILRVSENLHMANENKAIHDEYGDTPVNSVLIYKSSEMERILNIAVRAAASDSTILLRGESGTGKELIANLVHNLSPRKNNSFVVVNIAALSENLIESELFGHKKGSYTGAVQDRVGRFEEADKGTLFIDELGDIEPAIQVKLLRAIQFGKIERVGDNTTIQTNPRLIAATNQDLEQKIIDKQFREDLYYRLNVITIQVPPLRDRKTDIPMLIDHFLEINARKLGTPNFKVSHEAMDTLMKYDYPGNVRELQNILERACVLCRNHNITNQDIMLNVSKTASGPFNPKDVDGDFNEKLIQFEREMIQTALEKSGGNKSAAARYLGISERKLRSRMERIEL